MKEFWIAPSEEAVGREVDIEEEGVRSFETAVEAVKYIDSLTIAVLADTKEEVVEGLDEVQTLWDILLSQKD